MSTAPGIQALRAPADLWTIALGSGLRWTIDRLGPDAAREVERELCEYVASNRIDRVETNVIYALALKESKA